MTNTPDPAQDMLDSRDIIDRVTTLEEATEDGGILTEEEQEELATLRALATEGEAYADDWFGGVTLIRDSYFKRYAMDLADDIGAINGTIGWPHTCIDWDKAARELKMDYSAIDYDGVTYWVR